MNAIITKAIIIENSAAVLLARVTGADGTAITQADVSSLTAKVWEVDTATQIATPTLVVADCILDSLTTDARWDVDTEGYNFVAGLAGSCFPEGDKTYQAEIKVTPVSGDPFYVVYSLTTTNIYSE